MNSKPLQISIFLIIIILSGCAKKANLSNVFSKKKLEIKEFEFDYLSAKNRIRYADGSNSLSFTVTTRIRKDSLIWLSVSPGFGFEAARIKVTADSIHIMDRINKDYTVYSFAGLSSQFDMDLNFRMIQSLFTGNLPLPVQNDDEVLKEKENFIIRQQFGDFEAQNFIDSKIMKLSQLILKDNSGNVLNLQFSDFQLIEDRYFPYHADAALINVKQGNKKETQVSIDYSRIELQKDRLEFPFDVPQRYK